MVGMLQLLLSIVPVAGFFRQLKPSGPKTRHFFPLRRSSSGPFGLGRSRFDPSIRQTSPFYQPSYHSDAQTCLPIPQVAISPCRRGYPSDRKGYPPSNSGGPLSRTRVPPDRFLIPPAGFAVPPGRKGVPPWAGGLANLLGGRPNRVGGLPIQTGGTPNKLADCHC
jgi:hypothetical protein